MLAIEKNEILPFAAARVDPENIILGELSQMEILIVYNITYIWNLKYYTSELIYRANRFTDIENLCS